jgi:hypothetical protein
MRTYLVVLGLFVSLMAAQGRAHAQAGIACLLSCVNQPSCEVSIAKRLRLSGDTFTYEVSCDAARVVSGNVLVRYRRKGAWFSPPEAPKENDVLDSLFKSYPPDACSVPTPGCLQSRLNSKVAAIAGHGIDGQQASPGGSGDPCKRGLPCGLVLAPQANWQFKLNEPFDGQWQVRLLRGEPRPGGAKEWIAPIAAGVVTADGQQFEAGRVYAYRLVDRSRAVVATGEFETVGAKRMEILQRLAQRRVSEGMPERAAWIDTMLNAELEWDAFHAVAGN